MNSYNSNKDNDSTISGQEGHDEGGEERSENLSEENTKMNDENEFDGAGAAEADRSKVHEEGPELADLLKQASRLLRRKLIAAAAAGEFENRGQAIREEVDAVVDEALSDEELESLTDSLSRIVDVLGRNAEGADDEWSDPREFAGRRGYAARREFARRFADAGKHTTGPDRRHGWDPHAGWGSRQEWDEGTADEVRFGHHHRHEGCRSEVRRADHRGHRPGGRRRGMDRMAGAAFKHGFAAGYEHGAGS